MANSTAREIRESRMMSPPERHAKYRADALETRGLMIVPDTELEAPLDELGLIERHPTGYDTRLQASHTQAWAPPWAVKVVQEAMDTGEDPAMVVREYYKAVRDLPDGGLDTLLTSPDLLE